MILELVNLEPPADAADPVKTLYARMREQMEYLVAVLARFDERLTALESGTG